MPNIDQYAPGQYAVQDNSGNWVSYGADQGAAERAYNNLMGYSNAPTAPLLPTGGYGYGGMTMGGGSQFLGPAIDAASAAAQQQYLRDRLNQLDIPMSQAEQQRLLATMTGYYLPGSAAPEMSNEQALDYIWQSRPDLADFYRANGWSVDTPEQRRAAVQNWIDSVEPSVRGKTPQQVAQGLGAAGGEGFMGGYAGQEGVLPTLEREQWLGQQQQAAGNLLASLSGPRYWVDYWAAQPALAFGEQKGSPSWEQALANFWRPSGGAGGTGSSAMPDFGFTQGKDVNIGQWNQWSPSRQQGELGRVSAAGVDPNDWLRQMKAAAPTGQAAANTYWR